MSTLNSAPPVSASPSSGPDAATAAAVAATEDASEDAVAREMLRYEAIAADINPRDLPPDDLLTFWCKQAGELPLLAAVARSVLGFVVSAGAIERDFSTAGIVLPSRRNRLSSAYFQMLLFLKLNPQQQARVFWPPTPPKGLRGTANADAAIPCMRASVAHRCSHCPVRLRTI